MNASASQAVVPFQQTLKHVVFKLILVFCKKTVLIGVNQKVLSKSM